MTPKQLYWSLAEVREIHSQEIATLTQRNNALGDIMQLALKAEKENWSLKRLRLELELRKQIFQDSGDFEIGMEIYHSALGDLDKE